MAPTVKDYVGIWRSDATVNEVRETYEVDAYDPSLPIFRPEVLATIEAEIVALDEDLRALSLDIHSTDVPLGSFYSGDDTSLGPS